MRSQSEAILSTTACVQRFHKWVPHMKDAHETMTHSGDNDDARAFDAMPLRDDALLNAEGAKALDVWIAAHAAGLQLQSEDTRTSTLQSLFGMLAAMPVEDRHARIERVMDTLALHGAFEQRHDDDSCIGPVFQPLDDDALYALVMAGYNPQRVPASLRERAHKHVALANLVTNAVVPEPSAPLADRTMARIERATAAVVESERVEQTRAGSLRSRLRWSDVAGIAAMLVIGASIVIPVLGHFRREALRFACDSNLAQAGIAFSSYMSDNSDRLPIVRHDDQTTWTTWWNVGSPTNSSNSANLYVLVAKNYIHIHDLACPCNDHARRELPNQPAGDWLSDPEVSYSYRIVAGLPSVDLTAAPRTMLLADRSPIVTKNRRGVPASPDENSELHRGRGQTVLFGDGSTQWLTSPVLNEGTPAQDNIWLPRSVEMVLDQLRGKQSRLLNGVESPASRTDNFVGP